MYQDLLLLRRGASLLPVRLVGIASPALIFIVVVTVVRLSYRPLFVSSLVVWLLTTGVYAYFLFIISTPLRVCVCVYLCVCLRWW